MSTAWRTAPLLVIGLALIGCARDPAGTGPAASNPKADLPHTTAASDLATVQLNIPGMT